MQVTKKYFEVYDLTSSTFTICSLFVKWGFIKSLTELCGNSCWFVLSTFCLLKKQWIFSYNTLKRLMLKTQTLSTSWLLNILHFSTIFSTSLHWTVPICSKMPNIEWWSTNWNDWHLSCYWLPHFQCDVHLF